MTTGPIQPKETALAAIQAGLLLPAGVYERAKETQEAEIKAQGWSRILLPEEAGIAKIKATPPAPSSKLLLRKKGNGGNKKWIITRKQRPDLFK